MPARLRFEIFPEELDRTVEFYVRVLDFELLRDDREAVEPYVYMRRGEVRIGAVPGSHAPARALRRPPVGIELVLEMDDLEAERARILSAGWTLEEDVIERPWGLRDFRLLDPDGYYWRITTGQ